MSTVRKPPPEVELPAPGAAYLFEVGDGRFGVCRVLRHTQGEELKWMGRGALLVTSAWMGTEAPSIDDPALREPLRLTHHTWDGSILMGFVGAPPPEGMSYLGEIPPTAAERAMECGRTGSWDQGSMQLLLEWRWQHDREALLAEEALVRDDDERRVEEARARQERMRTELTWETLRAKVRFPAWEESFEARLVARVREIFIEAIVKLEAIGAKPKRHEAKPILRGLVEGLNRLNRGNELFIETIEREALCAEIDEIAFLAGFGVDSQIADEWRDW